MREAEAEEESEVEADELNEVLALCEIEGVAEEEAVGVRVAEAEAD